MESEEHIYVATWERKHGQDLSAHATRDAAENWCHDIMKDSLCEWTYHMGIHEASAYQNMTGKELWECWSEITGDTEFFSVEKLLLNH